MKKSNKHKILFVCMGNICRSPSAEGILLNKVKTESIDKEFIIDSCGTHGYHEGYGPDSRSIEVALDRGIDIRHQISRKIEIKDFEFFDLILPMDNNNLEFLINISDPIYHHKILLFLEFSQQSDYIEVPDPYYGGDNGFELVQDLLDEAAEGLINHLVNN
jgi:protein-tyrosine phosphatase